VVPVTCTVTAMVGRLLPVLVDRRPANCREEPVGRLPGVMVKLRLNPCTTIVLPETDCTVPSTLATVLGVELVLEDRAAPPPKAAKPPANPANPPGAPPLVVDRLVQLPPDGGAVIVTSWASTVVGVELVPPAGVPLTATQSPARTAPRVAETV
jgi:hypothetical protein